MQCIIEFRFGGTKSLSRSVFGVRLLRPQKSHGQRTVEAPGKENILSGWMPMRQIARVVSHSSIPQLILHNFSLAGGRQVVADAAPPDASAKCGGDEIQGVEEWDERGKKR